MSQNRPQPKSNPGLGSLPPWAIIAIFVAIVATSWWQTNGPGPKRIENARAPSSTPDVDPRRHPSHDPVPVEVTPDQPGDPDATTSSDSKAAEADGEAKIPNQTIRDQDGHVLFRGTVDLKPTLDRISSGGKNSHRNDGTTFQNRERRLPAKSSGYYKEYVHPTPGASGPGPQRVIVGKDGDIWYTPDHYKTFKQIR